MENICLKETLQTAVTSCILWMANTFTKEIQLTVVTFFILYTFDGKHMYKGNSTNSSNILYTFDGKHIYNGNSTNSSNILYTFDGKYFYTGNSTNSSNILLTVNGHFSMALFPVIL
jgi:hypothetical protein